MTLRPLFWARRCAVATSVAFALTLAGCGRTVTVTGPRVCATEDTLWVRGDSAIVLTTYYSGRHCPP